MVLNFMLPDEAIYLEMGGVQGIVQKDPLFVSTDLSNPKAFQAEGW